MASPFENMQAAVKRSSLLATPDATDSIFMKDIELLHEDPTNPRSPDNKGYDEEALQDFAEDIKERGILNPLTITPHPSIEGHFMVIAGHRRLRAARLAGLAKVPAVIRQTNDLKGDQIAENIHRENLNNFEIAAIIKSYLDQGMSTREVSRKLHKSQSYVQIYSKYLSAPDYIRQLADSGQISDMTAVSLLVTCYAKNETVTKKMIESAVSSGKVLSASFAKEVKEAIEFSEIEDKQNKVDERFQNYLRSTTSLPVSALDNEEDESGVDSEPAFSDEENPIEETATTTEDEFQEPFETEISEDSEQMEETDDESKASNVVRNYESFTPMMTRNVEIIVKTGRKVGSLLFNRKPSQEGHVWVKFPNEIADCECSKLTILAVQDKRDNKK